MIEISVFNLALMVEVIVILLAVCGVVGFLAVRRRSKAKQAALTFAAKAKESLAVQKEQLAPILEKFSVPDQEGTPTTVDGFVDPEKALFNGLLNVFVRRDADALLDLNTQVSGVTTAYQAYLNAIPERKADETPAEAPEAVAPDGDSAEMIERLTAENAALVDGNQHLKEENERLSGDTKTTLETMSHMMTEYSALYAAGDGARSITMDNLLKACSEIDPDDRGVINVSETSDAPETLEVTEVLETPAPTAELAPSEVELPVETSAEEEVVSESVDESDGDIHIEVATASDANELPVERAEPEPEVAESVDDDDDIMIEIEADDEKPESATATDVEVETMLSEVDDAEEVKEDVPVEQSSDGEVSAA